MCWELTIYILARILFTWTIQCLYNVASVVCQCATHVKWRTIWSSLYLICYSDSLPSHQQPMSVLRDSPNFVKYVVSAALEKAHQVCLRIMLAPFPGPSNVGKGSPTHWVCMHQQNTCWAPLLSHPVQLAGERWSLHSCFGIVYCVLVLYNVPKSLGSKRCVYQALLLR